MNTVQKVRDRLWFNGRRIINDLELTNLDKMKLEKVSSRDRLGDKSVWLYPDSLEEMVDTFRNSFSGFITFHDSFRCKSRHVWINADAEISMLLPRNGHLYPFLGEWIWDGWNDLEVLMKRQWARKYIVRREWYDIMRKKLLDSRVMPCDEEMCELITV